MYRTVREAAERLRVHPRTVRRLIRSGRLPATRVGKEWRIPDQALERLAGGERLQAGRIFMTTDEFLRLPEENLPVQLIKGYVVRDPAPYVPHQILVGRLFVLLHHALAEPGRAIVLLAPTDVVLSDDTVLQPDLLAVRRERRAIIGRRVEGAPDLVVEVEAEHTRERDLTVKRMLYARHGVPEFWFVSGSRRLLIQFTEPVEDDYRRRTVHERPARAASHAFPSLTVELAPLFKDC